MNREEAEKIIQQAAGGARPSEGDALVFRDGRWVFSNVLERLERLEEEKGK
jgi:hypothetical protein